MVAMSNRAEQESSSGEATRLKIMDAAESLIIQHGFAATSLRAIANAADVNLAATHYHFGSKQGLLAAVFHRRMRPVGIARLGALSELEAGSEPLTVDAILKAFFVPFYDAEGSELLTILPGLVARIYAEPATLTQPILEEEFSEVASRFVAALLKACPGVPEQEMRWRFHFMVGSMIQFLKFHTPIGVADRDNEFRVGLDKLVAFTVAGIEQLGAIE
ncbi:MAG: TetR family transcriptional regulator [Pseudomonadales bacterium]|nr:TetR family transcriptional regulator [Pseudomonadales bacterium]